MCQYLLWTVHLKVGFIVNIPLYIDVLFILFTQVCESVLTVVFQYLLWTVHLKVGFLEDIPLYIDILFILFTQIVGTDVAGRLGAWVLCLGAGYQDLGCAVETGW